MKSKLLYAVTVPGFSFGQGQFHANSANELLNLELKKDGA
jgi:hypothetical protein